MAGVRRATVTAQSDDLAVLADDAHRRGISLSSALGELVSVRAEELRRPSTAKARHLQVRIDDGHRRPHGEQP